MVHRIHPIVVSVSATRVTLVKVVTANVQAMVSVCLGCVIVTQAGEVHCVKCQDVPGINTTAHNTENVTVLITSVPASQDGPG